ncbi:MAG TPA: hypothetical protein VFZ75_05625 [Actinomycetota bacterium]|nr:hypothetical protein [Actinomycetota bacterium]
MSGEQAALDLGDVRSPNERYADDYRASLRERASTTALQAARVGDPDGHELAVRTIRRLVAERGSVTADDVQAETPIKSNAIGSAFATLSCAGEIRVVGYTTAKAPQAHGRLVRVWGPP